MLHEDVKLDVGGTLRLTPPETGRPSSASCSLYTPAGALIGTASVTVDAVSTTVSANASEGDLSLTLTSVASVAVRGVYQVTCDDGERLTVRVRAIRGSVVDLYAPLPRDVDSTSTFYGTSMTAPVSAARATPLGDGYEARWEYTADSVALYATTRYSVVRSVWPAYLGTVAGLRDYAGRLLTPEREASYERGSAYLGELERASRSVRLDLISRGRTPSRFRTFANFDDVVYQRVLLDLAESGMVYAEAFAGDPLSYIQLQRERYDRMLTQALTATADYDSDEDGVVSDAEKDATPRVNRWLR